MKLLGPVFWYDLVRIARRQWLTLWRAVYGLALLAALFLLYQSDLPHAWFDGARVRPNEATAFAARFFGTFTVMQFAAVILLMPALAANALAEEKGRNVLAFLLTTHLTSREIVLGKLFARLLQVGLLVLTGLPVLGLVLFLGGVEPALILASFAALALTGLSLGGLGVAWAVCAKKPQTATWRAYLIVLAYAALSALSIWHFELPVLRQAIAAWTVPIRSVPFNMRGPGTAIVWSVPPTPAPPTRTLPLTLLEGFNFANPYFAYSRLHYEQEAGRLLTDALPEVLRDYALAHGLLALAFVGLAVGRLRAASARQATGLTHKTALVLRPAPHPPVGERPVLWKEVYCEAKPRQRWLTLFFSRWFFAASFLPAWVFLVLMVPNVDRLAESMFTAIQYLGTLIAFGLCLRLALQAARSLGQERDRQTLDGLLLTDLTPDEIVRGKWWGSFLAGRWVLLWLLTYWGLGVLALALDPLAVALLVVECLVYGAFFVSLGMFCAAYCPTTKQAATATLVIGLVGPFALLWMVRMVVMLFPEWRARQQHLEIGLTPVWVLFESAFPNTSFNAFWRARSGARIGVLWPWIVLGLTVYAVAAAELFRRAAARFRRAVRGHEQRPPGRRPAAPEAPDEVGRRAASLVAGGRP